MLSNYMASLLRKEPRKLFYPDVLIVADFLKQFPFFSQILKTDKQTFSDVVKELHYRKFEGELQLVQEQSCEFLLVLTGKMEIVRKIYEYPAENLIKRRKKKKLISRYYSLGWVTEGETAENIGYCRLVAEKHTTVEIVFLTLKSYEKAKRDFEGRKTMIKLDIIKDVALFNQIDYDLLKKLAYAAYRQQFSLNNTIYHINDPIEAGCYILLSGSVKLLRQQMAKDNPPFRNLKVEMSVLTGNCQLFGEEYLLGRIYRRLYTVICTTERVEVLTMPKDMFVQIMQAHIKVVGSNDISEFYQRRDKLRSDLMEKGRRIMRKHQGDILLPQLTSRDRSPLDLRPSKPDFSTIEYKIERKSIDSGEMLSEYYKLIKNSHMLLQAVHKRRSSGGVLRSNQTVLSYSPSTIKKQSISQLPSLILRL